MSKPDTSLIPTPDPPHHNPHLSWPRLASRQACHPVRALGPVQALSRCRHRNSTRVLPSLGHARLPPETNPQTTSLTHVHLMHQCAYLKEQFCKKLNLSDYLLSPMSAETQLKFREPPSTKNTCYSISSVKANSTIFLQLKKLIQLKVPNKFFQTSSAVYKKCFVGKQLHCGTTRAIFTSLSHTVYFFFLTMLCTYSTVLVCFENVFFASHFKCKNILT